ncbi:MAG: DUF3299 domain-containing protein [Alphaproteobacteria bacterium]|nr:DUF3299 domain-containing protein [Alphaproteobacteria bacterium]
MKARLIVRYVVLLALAATPAWALNPKAGTVPTGQPPDELAAQKLLPTVNDALWTKLTKCAVDYDNDKGTYSIRLTPEVKALDGKTITLRGFVLPMDGSDHTQHFLVSRNTPVCLYCPPGQPNEVVEVEAARAIPWTNKIVSVTGQLRLINDEEKALFFKIEKAEAK